MCNIVLKFRLKGYLHINSISLWQIIKRNPKRLGICVHADDQSTAFMTNLTRKMHLHFVIYYIKLNSLYMLDKLKDDINNDKRENICNTHLF